jgi:hypothetical protein
MTATLAGSIRKRLTAPDTAEASSAVRGFDTSGATARTQLEASALQFIIGYEFGIEQKDFGAPVTRPDALEREYRGFAYEGAAMALAVRDAMPPLPTPKAFCGCTAEQASDIAAEEINDLPEDGTIPAYEVFRQRIQRHFR